MNSIPLIKGNTPQEINTSIIALKKALSELEAQDRLLQGTDKDVQDKIKQINELIEGINTHLGTVDTHLTAIDNQITALQPVDTVTSGNMHSVTSNAVFNAVGQWEEILYLGDYGGRNYVQGISTSNGKYIRLRLVGLENGSHYNSQLLFTLPEGWRPTADSVRVTIAVDTNVDRIMAGFDIHANGEVKVYFNSHTPLTGQIVDVSGFYSDAIIPLF
jgi:hypothetical protein